MSTKQFRLADLADAKLLGEFTEGENPDAQILRAGIFQHPWYGQFAITNKVLEDMKRNFDNRVRRQDIPVDYFHENDREAAGWMTELYLSEDKSALYAKVNWTPTAKKKLAEKEIRYFSAEFAFEWTDEESGVTYNNVLFGGGLVNRPFVKDMKPVVGLKEISEGDQMKTAEQMQAEVSKLSETIVGKDAEIKTLGEQNAALKGEIATLKKASALAEQEASFAKLLSDGKACAAQKEAYLAGDMAKFAELAQPLNVVAKGGDGGNGESAKTLSAEEKAVCKSLGLTEEEFVKYNQ